MKQIMTILAVLAVLTFFASKAAAQNGTIGWANTFPQGASKTITAQGPYTVTQGWTLVSISMTATPNLGGMPVSGVGGSNNFAMGPGGGGSGNWGDGNGASLVLMNVPPGQYTVFATITVKMGNMVQTYNSPISTVNVAP